jgi:dienelactone hydrolase
MDTTSVRRKELYALLGDLPPRAGPPAARKIGEEIQESYIVETLLLDLNGVEAVPALFVRPQRVTGRFPVVLYNHAHGGDYILGKNELIVGRAALQQPPYAQALAAHGYGALSIDAWAFGDRRGRTESAIFKWMLWHGRVMWGMMVFDSLRAIDYLATRDDVDMARLATLGLSMGSTMAWWVAALDVRVRVCVDLCCLTDYQALIESQGLDEHDIYYYVPRLVQHFSTAEINALIAPRPHLSLAGNFDRLTPPAGLDRIDAHLRRVYAEQGASSAWQLLRYEVGHIETAAMRAEALSFLHRWLS